MNRDRVGYEFYGKERFERTEVRDYWTGELVAESTDWEYFIESGERAWKECWIVHETGCGVEWWRDEIGETGWSMGDEHSESSEEKGRKGDAMGRDMRGDIVARDRDCGLEGKKNDVEGTGMKRDMVGYTYYKKHQFKKIEVRDYWTGELLVSTKDWNYFSNLEGYKCVSEWKESWVVEDEKWYPLWTEKGRD